MLPSFLLQEKAAPGGSCETHNYFTKGKNVNEAPAGPS